MLNLKASLRCLGTIHREYGHARCCFTWKIFPMNSWVSVVIMTRYSSHLLLMPSPLHPSHLPTLCSILSIRVIEVKLVQLVAG